MNLGRLQLFDSQSLITARSRIHSAAKRLGCREIFCIRLETLYSELFRKCLLFGDDLELNFSLAVCQGRQVAEIVITGFSAPPDLASLPKHRLAHVTAETLAEGSAIRCSTPLDEEVSGWDGNSSDERLQAVRDILAEKSRNELLKDILHKNEELEHSRTLIHSVLENIDSIVYAKDLEGRYTLVNHDWEAARGFSQAQVIGRRDIDIFRDGESESSKRLRNDNHTQDLQVMVDAVMFKAEEVIVTPEGAAKQLLTVKIPLIRQDEVYGISSISIDITEQKELYAELEEARKIAEDAAETKSAFLANMSHEIRTPMNAIIGMAHLVGETELNDRQQGYVENIQKSGELLLGIINDILDYSKIEAGKLDIEETVFSLSEVLRTLRTIIDLKCETKGLRLAFEIGKQIPVYLIGDPLRIGQILINYANNAVKFTQEGGVTVRISLVGRQDTIYTLRFEVVDTGIGLTEEQMGKLFSSFSQADVSITRQYGGSGLGLSISKNLAQMMHGTVGVSSVYGEGSTFWFTVPLHIDEGHYGEGEQPEDLDETFQRELDHPTIGRGNQENGPVPVFREASVLLVEDNELNIQVAEGMLEKWGIKPAVARNGEIALSKVKDTRYDLIFMDMQMPVMDGITASHEIRKVFTIDELPIIAMTANAMAEDIEKCAQAGMNGHIAKPIEPDKLLGTLQQYLKSYETVEERPDDIAGQKDMEKLFIPGLRAEAAVDRLGGSWATYRDLLELFLSENKDTEAQLTGLLESGQFQEAQLLAHTVKGTAGAIGAVQTADRAKDVETALKNQEDPGRIADLVSALAGELNPLLGLLRSEFAAGVDVTGQSTSGVGAVLTQESLGLLYDLGDVLKKHNPKRSKEAVNRCLEQAWPNEIAEGLSELEKMVKGFRYKDAIVLIERLISSAEENRRSDT